MKLQERRAAIAAAGTASPILDDAEAYWKVSEYSGSGALLDLSGNGHDWSMGAGASSSPKYLAHPGPYERIVPEILGQATAYWSAKEYDESGTLTDLTRNGHDFTIATPFAHRGVDAAEYIRLQGELYHDFVPVASTPDIGVDWQNVPHFADLGFWHGSVASPNGYLFFCPRMAHEVAYIDPNGDGFTTDFGLDFSLESEGGESKWYAGVYCPDDKHIWMCPTVSRNFLRIDPFAMTAELVTPADLGIDPVEWALEFNDPPGSRPGAVDPAHAWQSIIYSPIDHCMYLIPYESWTIVKVNPLTFTGEIMKEGVEPAITSMGVDLTTAGKFKGGVIASDNCIYGIPRPIDSILKIDVVNQVATLETYGLGDGLSGNNKWQGGAFSNDVIFFMPQLKKAIGRIFVKENRADLWVPEGITFTDGMTYGAFTGPDGKVYGAPDDSGTILVIDPFTDPMTAYTSSLGATVPTGDNSYFGGGMHPTRNEGYFVVATADEIIKIDFTGVPQAPTWVWTSSTFNRF